MAMVERGDPCRVCEHYHNYEEGETCDICGHFSTSFKTTKVFSFPSEILPNFLYLGGYNDASNFDLYETYRISRILNTVPLCENVYGGTYIYHHLQDAKALEFDSAINFLDMCEKEKYRVLVHCISGRSRSPAIVIGYLMKRNGWRLTESYHWVKQRRPSTNISPEFQQQLKEFEERLFGSRDVYGLLELNNQLQHLAFGSVSDDVSMDTC